MEITSFPPPSRFVPNEGWRATLILIAILILCFWPCIGGGKTLLASAGDAPSILRSGAYAGKPSDSQFPRYTDPGAAAWQNEPWLAFIGAQYRAGKLPLWNPYQAYGSPLAANMQSQPFYPLTALLSLWLTPRTYNFFLLSRLFIAGIFAYFYLRLFLSFTAALGGSIAMMLSGYYILFISMPHLSVEVLIPAVLWAGEYLLRRQSFRAVVWLAIAVALVFLGGMPESALLLVTFAAAYLLFRIFSDTSLRRRWRQLIELSMAGGITGAGLSAFLLVPFFEYMTHSSSPHEASRMVGLTFDKFSPAAINYLFPLLFGPVNAIPIPAEPFRSYAGLIPLVLALIAVGCAVSRLDSSDRKLSALTAFFAVSGLAVVLKQFGFVGVNWIGALPFFNLVQFYKYGWPILAFCVSALCAIGIERLVRQQVSLWVQAIVIVAACGAFWFAVGVSRKYLAGLSQSPAATPHWAILLPGILFAIFLLGIVADRVSRRWNRWSPLPILALLLVAVELSFNYIVPVYRIYGQLPSVRRNPYAGAPYIRFLQSHTYEHHRVFGRNWLLMPSWASVFQLSDIRDMDGLYYRKYFPFLQNFIAPADHEYTDLRTAFLGNGSYDFGSPLEKRFLQLSSVRYLVADNPYVAPNPRIDEILAQNRGRLTPLVGRIGFILDGGAREALGEHPPSTRLPYNLKVPGRDAVFHFSYALSPAVFSVRIGDGVGFTIELQDPSGRIEKLFSNYIDPKHNPQQRRWMDGAIDLTQYRRQTITLLFSTDPGPRNDPSFDWAAWSDFHFESDPPSPAPDFRPVYDAETQIYEYGNILPRAAIFFDAIAEKGEDAVLKKLTDPLLDVFRTVVLDGTRLNPQQAALAKNLSSGPVQNAQTAKITRYVSDAVEIESNLSRPGILVLNDSDYPGWRVSVDGHPGRWVTANYLFRGVFLNSGPHKIKYEYHPASFYLGAGLSVLSCSALAGFAFVKRRRMLNLHSVS